jgi:hypothetical protein
LRVSIVGNCTPENYCASAGTPMFAQPNVVPFS